MLVVMVSLFRIAESELSRQPTESCRAPVERRIKLAKGMHKFLGIQG